MGSYMGPVAEGDMPARFCDLGMRVRTLYVLSGSILTYWRFLDRTLSASAGSSYAAAGAWGQAASAAANSQSQHNVKLQLVRLRITPDSALPPERRAIAAGAAGSAPLPVDELNKRDYIVGTLKLFVRIGLMWIMFVMYQLLFSGFVSISASVIAYRLDVSFSIVIDTCRISI